MADDDVDDRHSAAIQELSQLPSNPPTLLVFKTLARSQLALIQSLRLLESSLKTYVYLSPLIRSHHHHHHPPTPTLHPPNQAHPIPKLWIVLSSLSIIYRLHHLILPSPSSPIQPPQAQAHHLHPILDPPTPSSSNQLKSRLESYIHSIQLAIDLLDDLNHLHFLRLIRISRSTKARIDPIFNLLNLLVNLLNYAHSSIDKAQLWSIGRRTRASMLETERTIDLNKRSLNSQSNLTPSRSSATLRPRPTEVPSDSQAPSDSSRSSINLLQAQINSDLAINRSRKSILRRCKRSLDRIWWSRILYSFDALVSAYDLLQLNCLSYGVRTLIDSIRSILDFQLLYRETWQSLATADDRQLPKQ